MSERATSSDSGGAPPLPASWSALLAAHGREGAPFTLVWHRAGNDRRSLERAIRAARAGTPPLDGRPVVHGVECDLKWLLPVRTGGGANAQGPAEPLCYLHHGPTGLERLALAEVERRVAAGEVLWLSQALALEGAADLLWMVEGKRGDGPLESAHGACARTFAARGARGRMLFAHRSLGALDVARRVVADIPTAVFASHIFRSGKILHVPKTCVWAGLGHGLLVDPRAVPVDAVSCVSALTAGRPCGRPQLSIARSWEEARRLAALGTLGAFCYFEPEGP